MVAPADSLVPLLSWGRFFALEHFPCCWVSRELRAVAFSSGKTPIVAESPRYTHRENALAEDSSGDERARVDVFKGYGEVEQGHDPIGFVGGEVEAEDAVVRGEPVGDLAE